jgi:hypothetical protein
LTDVTFDGLLRRHVNDLALLIGNGINRYGGAGINSWDALLIEIAHDCAIDVGGVPPGTALTEFYDILELKGTARTTTLQGEFCKLMAHWRPLGHHRTIMGWAQRHDVPVLTTNFDEVLSEAAEARFFRPDQRPFTDFYPWDCRFGRQEYRSPCEGFGIWHINGMARYRRSVRLGLSHYMGSVHRARGWLHRGDGNLFDGKNRQNWAGARSWMHLVFNKPLLIFGLALGENEVFLRWLLIERARYFSKYPDRKHPAWYVYTHDPADDREKGKAFFLEAIGIRCVEARDFEAIYDAPTWHH